MTLLVSSFAFVRLSEKLSVTSKISRKSDTCGVQIVEVSGINALGALNVLEYLRIFST